VEPTEITAGRLHLRPWQEGDQALLVAVGNDPDNVRWTNVPSPYTREEADRWVRETAPTGWASGGNCSFAVCDSTSGEVRASVALRPACAERAWEVRYWCAPRSRGQGVVPEALGVLCRWGFAELGAARIEWMAEVGNWASRRAAEKAGFRMEGLLRGGVLHRGQHVDGWIGGRLPDDPDADTAKIPPYEEQTDAVVTLRRWRLSDAPDVARACADAETARWLPVPVPYTLESAREYVGNVVPAEWSTGSAANVAVVDARDGCLLGAVGLTLRTGIGEIGYWTAPEARGRGVAVRAARLHAEWGFRRLGLPRIELVADVDNPASQRVAEKAGWVREGVARSLRPAPRDPSRRRDFVVFAKLP
jgi:RimJ/RimL family protein N-acetyltransferase